MAPKGKQGTKGAKQIKQENEATIKFYTCVIVGSYVPIIFLRLLWSAEGFGYLDWTFMTFSALVLGLGMKTMHSMASSNLDLSMHEGMGEHLKDIVLVTAACQVLGTFSHWFWLAWLLIPAVALYKLWVGILAPWFFQEATEPTEKQKRKMDRRQMRRQQ